MRLPNPEDWPLSQRSVAGPEAAPRTPFLEIQSEEGITIVFLPVPCGADVLPLSYFRRSVPHMVPPISVNVQGFRTGPSHRFQTPHLSKQP